MKLDSALLKQLSESLERKIFYDEMKVLDKQLRNLRKKISLIEEHPDLLKIHENVEEDVKELKKLLQSKNLL